VFGPFSVISTTCGSNNFVRGFADFLGLPPLRFFLMAAILRKYADPLLAVFLPPICPEWAVIRLSEMFLPQCGHLSISHPLASLAVCQAATSGIDGLRTKLIFGKDELLVALGKRIRELREERLWSQEEFADRSGLHSTAIGLLERAERIPRLDTLRHPYDGIERPRNHGFRTSSGFREEEPFSWQNSSKPRFPI